MFTYEYHIKDHLGNVRVTFEDLNNNGNITSNEIKSRNDYYSFGMEWNNRWELSDTISPENGYRYNGKEYVEEMGLNSLLYGARNMMPDIGRFTTIDRYSAKYSFQSGYSYGAGNPIKYIDVNGDSIDVFAPNGNLLYTINDGKKSNTGLYFQNSTQDKKGNISYSNGISFGYNDEKEDRATALNDGFKFNVVSDDRFKSIIDEGVGKAGSNMFSHYKAGRAGGSLDYFGKSNSPIEPYTLNIVASAKGGTLAYNANDFGNYLTGQSLRQLGYLSDQVTTAAHINNILNGSSDYGSRKAGGWLDSPADQRAILNGYFHYNLNEAYESPRMFPK
ncbi:MAG: hypothetical protein IPN86_15625 [Saprospiraceae bacterium]|nr:hypothetical protein [Saprospiraceae bacterium]